MTFRSSCDKALANEAMDEKRSWTTTDNDDSNDSDGSGKERRVGRVVLLDVQYVTCWHQKVFIFEL